MEEWLEQDKNSIRAVDRLREKIRFSDEEIEKLPGICDLFPLKITPYLFGLIDGDNSDCPIRRQVVPDLRETIVRKDELDDPIGDKNTDLNNQPVPGITHRYPDRALLYATTVCGVHCRYCFRRSWIAQETAPVSDDMKPAFDYIRRTKKIQEVILSGGDPLTLADDSLETILARLFEIDHVKTIRIHTRMPVVNPYRITGKLVDLLVRFSPVWLVTQFNHPREMTPFAKERTSRLIDRGVPILNQTVLLRGINDSADILEKLNRELIQARIKPYYLHHPDKAKGTAHFRLPLERGIRIMRELRRSLPGYATPVYCLDIPSGHGKAPIQHNYMQREKDGRIVIEAPNGSRHIYSDE